MPLPIPKQSPEPEAIERFISSGHPWMAFILAMSWQWRATIATCLLALMGFNRVL